MERLLHSGNLLWIVLLAAAARLRELTPSGFALTRTGYLPGVLAARYWVGVILQVFLNTRQK